MRVLFGLLLLSASGAWAASGTASACKPQALAFSVEPGAWQALPLSSLKTDTRYTVALNNGRAELQAEADNSASLYGIPMKPASTSYGVLSWQWKTDALVPGADNRDKWREDAPVRVIAAFGGDRNSLPDVEKRHFKLAKRMSGREPPYATLMYIWSEQVPLETVITSAHTSQVKMLVVATGSAGLGQWQTLRRDLRADYKRAFGEDAGPLLGIGVMTDTDNTGEKASARYADIRLDCAN